MQVLNYGEVQKLIRQHGAESCIMIADMLGEAGLGQIKLPFLPNVYYLLKPEDAHELMVKHGDDAHKLEMVQRLARSTFGNGILFSNGALWKRQRKLMQPAFHHAHVRGYGERMMSLADKHLAAWQNGATLDLAREMHQLTLKIVVDILFSSDASGTMDSIAQAIHDIGMGFERQGSSIFLLMMPDWFPHPAIQQKQRGAKLFRKILREKIAERRQTGEANSPKDLLSTLMYSKDPDTGETMDDEQLRGELLTLYVAGHETTAWLLSWSLAFLAENPEATAKLQSELALLEGKAPTVEDLAKLPYSKMVLQETLRMRPPVWFLQRQIPVPLTINGREYPKNSMFNILTYANHHNPEIFPEPKRYLPERWANDAEKHLPKGAYLPFATGSRICIGNGFAMMEAQLLLNRILQCYEIELLDKPEMVKGLAVILGFANTVRIKVKNRE